jgi:hypothetical protein
MSSLVDKARANSAKRAQIGVLEGSGKAFLVVDNKFIDVTDILLEDAFDPRLTSSGFRPKSTESPQEHQQAFENKVHRLCASELVKKTHATARLISEVIQDAGLDFTLQTKVGTELGTALGTALGKALGTTLGTARGTTLKAAFEAAYAAALESATAVANNDVNSQATSSERAKL